MVAQHLPHSEQIEMIDGERRDEDQYPAADRNPVQRNANRHCLQIPDPVELGRPDDKVDRLWFAKTITRAAEQSDRRRALGTERQVSLDQEARGDVEITERNRSQSILGWMDHRTRLTSCVPQGRPACSSGRR